MTPERAREISDAAFAEWETSDDSMQDAFTAAILAACAEERHAALTEAAEVINGEVGADEAGDNAKRPWVPYYDLRNAILALRDAEGT